jgi:hypothetical protein
VFNEFKQNGVAWAMLTAGAATTLTMVLSEAGHIPPTVYMMVFGPLTADEGENTPEIVFTPIPVQEPPGNDAESATAVPFAQSGADKSVIVTTG